MAYAGIIISLYSYSLFALVLHLCSLVSSTLTDVLLARLSLLAWATRVARRNYTPVGSCQDFAFGALYLHRQPLVPPYVPAAVLTVVVALLSDRYKMRGPFMLMLLPITIIGKHAVLYERSLITLTD